MKEIEVPLSDIEYFKQFLLERLDQARLSPSGRELTARCPICGDSTHNSTKKSFSINVDPESPRFMMFQCFRASCDARGVINDDFFDIISSDTPREYNKIAKYMSERDTKIGGKYKSRKIKELTNIISSESQESKLKLRYINNRLGLDLSFEDIYNFKINLNVNELYHVNEISVPKDKIDYYNLLSTYGVSFLSAYNDYLIIRDISKSGKIGKRYTNLNVFNNYEDATKCYCIPGTLDLLSPEPTIINIAEGAFDIIGVYHHTNIDRKYRNQIFLAACGANIPNTLRSYIQQYGLLNCKINVFADSDVPIESYMKINSLRSYLIKYDTTVYYNEKSKDFGTTPDNIKMTMTKL